MCGIAGIYSFKEGNFREKTRQMTEELAHRGPDAEGFYNHSPCFLGHRRLSVLDTSQSANQPLYSHCKRYVIVYNGEVYNFKELASKYSVKASTNSDTEIIVELFARMGTNFVEEINGMFSIAIYDEVEKALYLFRDRLGIKPLYYYHSADMFAFASELKSIKKILDTKTIIDRQSISNYLHLGYIPEPDTIYEGIKKFGSGNFALIKQEKVHFEEFWNSKDLISSNTLKDESKAKNQLHELLTSAVNYRMISDVPLGSFLSGGTDSSLVTAIAQKESQKPLKTFSIGFKESKFNESQYAREIAEYLKTDHHEFMLSEKDAIEKVTGLSNIYDEPFADSSAIPTMLISQMARKEVTVALSGDGGDELFLGYGMYNWANRLSKPLLARAHKPISLLLSFGGNRAKRASQVFDFESKSKIKSHIFSQEQYYFSAREIDALLVEQTEIFIHEDYPNLERSLYPDEEQALFDLNNYLKDDLLVKVDRASMHHSLEVRVPLLDHRIVEFTLNLNKTLKARGGIQKYLLKEVLYDYVPKRLLDRPKWGFSIPLQNWLSGDLKYLLDRHLSKDVIEKFNIVQYSLVRTLMKKFFDGQTFLYNRLWTLVLLHKWLNENE